MHKIKGGGNEMTSKFIFVFLTILMFFSGSLYAEKPVEFRLENRSGLTIFVLRLSPAGSGVWTNDVLDGDVIADRETKTVSFIPENAGTYWDMAVVDLEGDNYEWKAVRIIPGKPVVLPPPTEK
jgi:hypothetical protein